MSSHFASLARDFPGHGLAAAIYISCRIGTARRVRNSTLPLLATRDGNWEIEDARQWGVSNESRPTRTANPPGVFGFGLPQGKRPVETALPCGSPSHVRAWGFGGRRGEDVDGY
ncbi:hypothetical protein A9K55_006483 [Cordyceps militaris]|uniref:Uncharacterized protein n=1 Tax=Cordyceps militaris TaxID=73501 RepID=A0A2H4SAY6_CORMI|nr:hypothetical protein A9K55_006483 [Cordyceps militaris]